MKVLVKFIYGSTHCTRIIEGEGETPEKVVENYVNDNCLAQDGYSTAFGRDMLLGDITDISDISNKLANANYAKIGNKRYFRSKYNQCWYSVLVRGTGLYWWRNAHYSDDEMLEKGAEPIEKSYKDEGWNMCY